MAIYDQFDVDPAKNNKTPPYGAPEKGLSFDQISDTLRVVMAAIAEIAKIASTSAGALGTLGKQNANAVQITGGTIDGVTLTRSAITSGANGCSVDPWSIAHATHKIASNVLPLQELYNYVNPAGCVRLSINSNASDWKWPGTTSTWRIIPGSGDRFIVSAGTQTSGGQEAGTDKPVSQLDLSGDTYPGNPLIHYGTGVEWLTGVHLDAARYGMHVVQRTA